MDNIKKKSDNELKQGLNILIKDYYSFLHKFLSKNRLFSFNFNLNVLEYCSSTFDEIGLNNLEFTEKFFIENEFFLNKLCFNIKIKFSFENCFNIYVLYLFSLKIISILNKLCDLYTYNILGIEKLNVDELKELKKDQKYKITEKQYYSKNGQEFRHYFYEFNGLKFNIINSLQYFDSIRSTLIEKGDTLELIDKRDIVITLHKYYEYISNGILWKS